MGDGVELNFLKFIKRILCVIAAQVWLFGNIVYAEPVYREASAEIIAGFDFTVYQQQGRNFQFKFNDHSADFTSRADNPAKFNFNIQTTREDINQCSVHFITWRKQISDQLRKQLNKGASLDVFFTPGLAGRVSSDKTVYTGDGDFTVAYSNITADFFGTTKGDPFNPNIAEEILSSLRPSERVLQFSNPLDTKPYGDSDVYAYQDFFTSVPEHQDLKWLGISGSWGDERYVVYSLPCSSLITLPIQEEPNTPPVASDDNNVITLTLNSLAQFNPLQNDTDADGDPLVITKILPGHSGLKVELIDDRNVRVTSLGSYGTKTFSYEISDGNGGYDTARVTVNIPEPDTVKPTVSFLPSNLQVNSAGSVTMQLDITDNIGVEGPPVVTCTNGGQFSGSTFTAPTVKQSTTSVCTASARDAAGNTGTATLTVTVMPSPLQCPGAPGCPTGPPYKLIAGALALLLLSGAVLLVFSRRQAGAAKLKPQGAGVRPFKFSRSMLARPEKPDQHGVVFANSPLLAGAVAPGPAPLAPAGQMVPSGLQTLTGQYAALKPAYKATGRIGGPQEGVPTNDDVSFGTGFLITDRHIMTNQHVYEFYKHYLTGPDCGGIEFIAERDRDASDYVPFNGEPPLIIPDLDIAIFTLARAVTDRTPIDRVAIPTMELDTREVITVSYPCPFEVDDTILSLVEKDPVFAVKRLSQGHVFRHSTDNDTPFGVQVTVDAQINSAQSLLAICHNASTLGGSSGAPVLDLDGKLVGVHFAGDRAFNGEEAANLAMAIENLVGVNPT